MKLVRAHCGLKACSIDTR